MPAFSPEAVATFVHALAGVTCNQVQLEFGDLGAHTDGKTVFLPAPGTWKDADFRVICGTACHEVSHVWFASPDYLKRLLEDYPEGEKRRASRCFNALIDVADETRFASAMPRAEELFEQAAEAALRSARKEDAVPRHAPAQSPSEWLLLAAGIWLVRSRRGSFVRRSFGGWRKRLAGLADVCSILAQARDARANFTPERSEEEWQRLGRLTRELFELVKQHFPNGSPDDESGDVMRRWARAALDRGEDGQADAQPAPASDDLHRLLSGDLGPNVPGPRIPYDAALHARVLPAFRQSARRLAENCGMSFEDGYLSGKRLHRPHRFALDGRCFRRTVLEEGNEAAVALLFDHSHSMRFRLRVILPVGVAMADALDAVDGVEVAVWRFGTVVERLARIRDLENSQLLGSTMTHTVLAQAEEWLLSRASNRKVVVLFTDGEPTDIPAAAKAVRKLRAQGIQLLVGSIGVGLETCARAFPGAFVFSADPPRAASSLQVAIQRLRREG